MQIPIGAESDYTGYIDLITMKATIYMSDDGKKSEIREIPADMAAIAAEWREKMIEAISDFDDSIMERFLEGEEIDEKDIRAALRQGTIANKVVPILSGSSFKNKGVQAMLDAVVDYLPSPVDVGGVSGVHPRTEEVEKRNPSDTEPFAALAFKIMSDKYVGRLTYLRIYSGSLKKGSAVSVAYRDPQTNEFRTRTERIGRILEMHANFAKRSGQRLCGRHHRSDRPQRREHRPNDLRRRPPHRA